MVFREDIPTAISSKNFMLLMFEPNWNYAVCTQNNIHIKLSIGTCVCSLREESDSNLSETTKRLGEQAHDIQAHNLLCMKGGISHGFHKVGSSSHR